MPYKDPAVRKQKAKEWRQRTPEKQTRYGRTWRKKHPEQSKAILRNNNLLQKYGITMEEKVALWENQGRKCALRGCDMPEAHSRSAHLDHCHETKKVRGVVCASCNLLLGFFEKFKKDKALVSLIESYLVPT